ncbi:hypothetical protein F4680DRAFT_417900 [Xylaria scruposa]|nr:hypothetical protein F4680DRAFT_417900 [Xylaria scruposa]
MHFLQVSLYSSFSVTIIICTAFQGRCLSISPADSVVLRPFILPTLLPLISTWPQLNHNRNLLSLGFQFHAGAPLSGSTDKTLDLEH